MKWNHRQSSRRALDFERCEERSLLTLVFVLNGNAYSSATPNQLTADAAGVLQKAGNQAIQLSTPDMATRGAVYGVARQMRSLSHGQAIGIVGFSAGGTLAARLSAVKSLHVTAALDYYGPPDLRDFLAFHRGDHYDRTIESRVLFCQAAIKALSSGATSM